MSQEFSVEMSEFCKSFGLNAICKLPIGHPTVGQFSDLTCKCQIQIKDTFTVKILKGSLSAGLLSTMPTTIPTIPFFRGARSLVSKQLSGI